MWAGCLLFGARPVSVIATVSLLPASVSVASPRGTCCSVPCVDVPPEALDDVAGEGLGPLVPLLPHAATTASPRKAGTDHTRRRFTGNLSECRHGSLSAEVKSALPRRPPKASRRRKSTRLAGIRTLPCHPGCLHASMDVPSATEIVACHEHGTGLSGFLPRSWDHRGCQLWDHRRVVRLLMGHSDCRWHVAVSVGRWARVSPGSPGTAPSGPRASGSGWGARGASVLAYRPGRSADTADHNSAGVDPLPCHRGAGVPGDPPGPGARIDADVADVANVVDEDEVTGPHRAAGDVAGDAVLGGRVVRQPTAQPAVHVGDQPGAVESPRAGGPVDEGPAPLLGGQVDSSNAERGYGGRPGDCGCRSGARGGGSSAGGQLRRHGRERGGTHGGGEQPARPGNAGRRNRHDGPPTRLRGELSGSGLKVARPRVARLHPKGGRLVPLTRETWVPRSCRWERREQDSGRQN